MAIKTALATLGSILLIIGIIMAIPSALNRYVPGILITGFIAITGILLIAWAVAN